MEAWAVTEVKKRMYKPLKCRTTNIEVVELTEKDMESD